MNRPIKFRAWDGKKMKYQQDMRYLVLPGKETPKGFKDIVLMQYTGLKDKNDKEIYEGDILQYYQTAYWSGNRVKGGVSEVKWRNGLNWQGFGIGRDTAQFYEVIGNIYENPDLLNPTL